MNKGLVGLFVGTALSGCTARNPRFLNEKEPLVMTTDAVRDANLERVVSALYRQSTSSL